MVPAMSKSLTRVRAALRNAGLADTVTQTDGSARTAEDAAREIGCTVDQIAKSIVFRGSQSGTAVVFLTAGGNRVDANRATALAGEPLERADAAFIRGTTGFAIGGVSPVGHLTPPRLFFDPRLADFDTVYAAAGTPNHVFAIAPADLERLTGATRGDFVA